jgi:RecB family exonuclease
MFLEHFDKESFRKQVIDLIQELKIKYAGRKVKCEVKIHMNNGFINAQGRIDMLVYDSDGNVELVDFKTSSKDFSSIEYK